MTFKELEQLGIKTSLSSEQIDEMESERQRIDAINFETAKKGKLWFGYLFLATSNAERPSAFEKCAPHLTDKEYWELLNAVWTEYDATIVFHPTPYHVWERLFTAERSHRKFLMSATERRYLKGLPEWITVYRGCRPGMELEMSWTLSQAVAHSFAQRQTEFLKVNGLVISTQVHKDDVYAYFNGKSEHEIVWQPGLATDYDTLEELMPKSDVRVYANE